MIFKVLLLIFSFNLLAFDKDFKAVNDRVPLEFNLLFDSLKLGIKSPSEKIQLVGLAKELDENLAFLQKEHIFFLMKSEVIKNVLEYQHRKVRSFDMTSFLLERLEEDFQKKENFLTPFSRWIWRSILAELKYREKMGLITKNSFNPTLFDGPIKAEAQRFQRYLNYLLPWVDKMDSLSPPEFNELTKKVSWLTLRRLNDRSILFKRFASSATGSTRVTIINIPSRLTQLDPVEIKRMLNDEEPLSLQEESAKEKTEARKEVQETSLQDLSPLSDKINDEVNKELDKTTP